MTKSIEQAAEEYSKNCDNESGSFLSRDLIKIRKKAYIAGAKITQDQLMEVVNNLETLMYNNPNIRQDAYNQGVRDCIKRLTKSRSNAERSRSRK